MKAIFTFCALLFTTTMLFSQHQGTIAGRILDLEMNGEPLLFAHVTVKNTDKSTQTNFHGNFEFSEVAQGSYTLLISYPGYEPLEVPVMVKENGVTEISEGLSALSIDMDGISLSHAEAKVQQGKPTAAKYKGQK